MFTLYLHRNVSNGKGYIGQTGQTPEHRWSEHCDEARLRSVYVFHKAIKKWGANAFTHEVVGTFETEEEVKRAEIAAIVSYNTHYLEGHGYNMTFGGEGNRSPKSEETRRKIRLAMTGKKQSPEHIKNVLAGRKARPRTKCYAGHLYTEDNVYTRPSGARYCRTCKRARNKAWKAKKRKNSAPTRKSEKS